MLTWKLCNLLGQQLTGGRLDYRLPGGRVNVGCNVKQSASVTLSTEDPAAPLVYPLYTVLKVLLDDVPLFTGICLKPRFNLQAKAVQINAVDQVHRLEHLFVGQRADGAGLPGAVSWNPWRWEAKWPTYMIYHLLAHVRPTAAEISAGVQGHGIIMDYTEQGSTRNRDFTPGAQIWRSMMDFTESDDAVDLHMQALDETNGNLNKLVAYYPRMGTDKSASVIFHAGHGRHNATDFTWEPDGGVVVNRATITGQTVEGDPQRAARADQPESQEAFGQYGSFESKPDTLDQSVLNEFAQGAVSTLGWPQDFFSFIPAQDDGSGYSRDAITGVWTKLPGQYGKPPRFGPGPNHDYWLGDTIGCIARDKPGLNVKLAGRVSDGTFTELEDGSLAVEIAATPVVSEVGVTVAETTY